MFLRTSAVVCIYLFTTVYISQMCLAFGLEFMPLSVLSRRSQPFSLPYNSIYRVVSTPSQMPTLVKRPNEWLTHYQEDGPNNDNFVFAAHEKRGDHSQASLGNLLQAYFSPTMRRKPRGISGHFGLQRTGGTILLG